MPATGDDGSPEDLVAATADLVACAEGLATAWVAKAAIDAMVAEVDRVIGAADATAIEVEAVVRRVLGSSRFPHLAASWASGPDRSADAVELSAAVGRLAALVSAEADPGGDLRRSLVDIRAVAAACADVGRQLVDGQDEAWRQAGWRVATLGAARVVPTNPPRRVVVTPPGGSAAPARARAAALAVLAAADLPAELCVPAGVPIEVARRLRRAQRGHAAATWAAEAARTVGPGPAPAST